jgi:endoglucanase
LRFRFIRAAAACLAGTLLAAPAGPAAAMPPPDRLAVLEHGINLTNWFRFPARTDAASMRGYLSDSAIDELREAGFTFVRLAVQPEYLQSDPSRGRLLVDQIARLERHRLGVVVALHPAGWHLETSATDRAALLAVWQALAPALGALDPRLTFPEPLNEPVFAGDSAGWERLQARLLAVIRAALPASTVVLTGNDWGSIAGLLTLHPSTDANVIYSFHFYDPAELTSLAAWRPGLDRAALARLPFPVSDSPGCEAALGRTDPATRDVGRFYCTMRWNSDSIDKRIDEAAVWAGRAHVSLLAGEFGATARLNRPSRLAWLQAVRRACDRRGIGWSLWGYDDAMGLGVPRPPGPLPVLDEGVLNALGFSKSQSRF